jgi:hypothetical protein
MSTQQEAAAQAGSEPAQDRPIGNLRAPLGVYLHKAITPSARADVAQNTAEYVIHTARLSISPTIDR